jgi:MscS family membrane protein
MGAQQVRPADSTAATRVEESPSSPRAALERYLTLARAGRFADAAGFLDAPGTTAEGRTELARQLKAVLDRHLWFDLEVISGAAAGDTTDGLPRNVEQVGVIPVSDGSKQPVRLMRQSVDSAIRWRFSSATVQRVPQWYGELGDRWLLENLPASLLQLGPLDVLLWQWIAIIPLLVLALVIGAVASRVVRAIAARVAARTSVTWDDELPDRLGAPLTTALSMVALAALLPLLSLYQPAAAGAFRLIRVGIYGSFFWALWRLVDVFRAIVATSSWARASSSSRALLPLAGRVAKVLLAAMGSVALLSMLGYPVASLVAGLGIGGLALALAAQKTVENLFGAFSIGIDQPFREGDFVKIEDFVGTVEALGLRSTRFRTLDRTLISIPNGRLADMRLESFTARDRLRLATVIGLVYETSASQMRDVLAGFERVLREHPKIWPDAVVVRFREFAASSLDIEIMAWFQTPEWSEFQLIRQEVLLGFMEVVQNAGTSIAFPTRTVHLVQAPSEPGRDVGALSARGD